MRSTLFHIPSALELGGGSVPLFGWGLLLAVWAVLGGAGLAWAAARQPIAQPRDVDGEG